MVRRSEPAWKPEGNLGDFLGLLPSRYAIIMWLLRHPEGGQLSTIAASLGLDSTATRNQLRQLRASGLVESGLDPYFVPQGQRPIYTINRVKLIDELRIFADQAGLTLISAAEDPAVTELNASYRKIAALNKALAAETKKIENLYAGIRQPST